MHAYHTGSYEGSSKSLGTCLCYLLDSFFYDNLSVDRALYGLLALGVIKRKKKEKKQKPSIALDLLMKIIERKKEL